MRVLTLTLVSCHEPTTRRPPSSVRQTTPNEFLEERHGTQTIEAAPAIVGPSSTKMFLRYRTIKVARLDAAMTRLNTLIPRRVNAARQVSEIAAL
jgi:hypothetical protein